MRRTLLALLLALAACSRPIYYHEPKSDHFDGRHFFNPDGQRGTGGAQHETAGRYLDHALLHPRETWPFSMPVTRSVPPALLRQTLAARHIAPDRFRTIEAGEQWWIPSLAVVSILTHSSARPPQR